MGIIRNPLLEKLTDPVVNTEKALGSQRAIFSKPTQNGKRIIKRLVRKETAEEAVKDLTNHTEVFGFTKGQFSLIELIEAILVKTGPVELTVSTWTAANADTGEILRFLESGKVLSVKFLIDFSFQRRQPALAQAIRENFGKDSLRVTKNHAKFFLMKNAKWHLVGKTSMNLNTNARFEDFDLSNDRALFNFLEGIVHELFKKTSQKDQGQKSSSGHWQEWQNLSL